MLCDKQWVPIHLQLGAAASKRPAECGGGEPTHKDSSGWNGYLLDPGAAHIPAGRGPRVAAGTIADGYRRSLYTDDQAAQPCAGESMKHPKPSERGSALITVMTLLGILLFVSVSLSLRGWTGANWSNILEEPRSQLLRRYGFAAGARLLGEKLSTGTPGWLYRTTMTLCRSPGTLRVVSPRAQMHLYPGMRLFGVQYKSAARQARPITIIQSCSSTWMATGYRMSTSTCETTSTSSRRRPSIQPKTMTCRSS